MKTLLLTVALLLSAGSALAQQDAVPTSPPCTPVAAPTPYEGPLRPDKPVVPSCINTKTHMSTCSKKVLDKYNADVDAYNHELEKIVSDSNDYIETLNTYVRNVNKYSECEVQRINARYKEN